MKFKLSENSSFETECLFGGCWVLDQDLDWVYCKLTTGQLWLSSRIAKFRRQYIEF